MSVNDVYRIKPYYGYTVNVHKRVKFPRFNPRDTYTVLVIKEKMY